ncbi:nef protein [Simian immunodeficiency virus]|uniref:Protein Nef n=1 Tax=Simian immunodeficiency virus TaxID=11723 RepID=Q6EZD2_SIV|nr:nef protein [Simian immunodeficiency virus]
MGGKSSKNSAAGLLRWRFKMLTTPGEGYVRWHETLLDGQPWCAEGSGRASRDFVIRGGITAETQASIDDIDWYEDTDDTLVGFPVKPQVPLRPMSYKLAIDMSHFLKEKGGLEGIYWSIRRQRILDMYLENEHGIIPDWQNYTPGPGIRYPTLFGWLWQLVPVDVSDEAREDEEHSLLHPAETSGMEDPWGEVLAWKFNPMLAVDYIGYRLHPEFFGERKNKTQ